jgi:hypothetical protein
MWLLDTNTTELQSFLDKSIPQYAILSHTWGTEEVSFQDLQSSQVRIQNFDGYLKIKTCCAQAASDGFQYVWIDTCCIDKTSSAELSEAINSMFDWYRSAVECYVYLADISSGSDFSQSRWFTRGWTLQELIAPLSVVFFNQHWEEIGTKASLKGKISDITGIPSRVLLTNAPGEFSIAQIMSWAARRHTTRIEDVAYSLLGLFDVHMPMIYGEGKSAFIRLQHEILKTSDDLSLFAWTGTGDERGPFATSPAEFANCGNIAPCTGNQNSEYSMTNRGLHIKLPLVPCHETGEQLFVAFLKYESEAGRTLGIYLRRKQMGRYVRTRCKEVRTDKIGGVVSLEELYIMQPNPAIFDVSKWMRPPPELYWFTATYDSVAQYGFSLVEKGTLSDKGFWAIREEKLRLALTSSAQHGRLLFKHTKSGERFALVLGIHNWTVWSDIETDIGIDETLKDVGNSYYSGFPTVASEARRHRRSRSVWDSLDRITKSLSNGMLVKLVVRNTLVSGEKEYAAKITIC